MIAATLRAINRIFTSIYFKDNSLANHFHADELAERFILVSQCQSIAEF